MIAYHGKPELKTALLKDLAWHREQDKLTQGLGTYWRDGRGCAIGCVLESVRKIRKAETINHESHALYEKYLGVPQAIARLEDSIFESLPVELAQQWPERVASAIRPSADLSMVMPKFLHWLLSNPDGGVQQLAKQRPQVIASIQTVIDLYGRWIEGTKPSVEEWREARSAAACAVDAAAYAADAAAYAADAYAAYAADAAYAAYAAYAADAAADAAAAAAADAARASRSRERIRQADKLIELLEAA